MTIREQVESSIPGAGALLLEYDGWLWVPEFVTREGMKLSSLIRRELFRLGFRKNTESQFICHVSCKWGIERTQSDYLEELAGLGL